MQLRKAGFVLITVDQRRFQHCAMEQLPRLLILAALFALASGKNVVSFFVFQTTRTDLTLCCIVRVIVLHFLSFSMHFFAGDPCSGNSCVGSCVVQGPQYMCSLVVLPGNLTIATGPASFQNVQNVRTVVLGSSTGGQVLKFQVCFTCAHAR